MAARRKRRAYRMAAGRVRRTPGWLLVLAGLVVGAIGVAAGLYVRDRLLAVQSTDAPARAAKPAPKPARTAPSAAPPEKDYDFYEMLPNFEVIVPEEERDVRADRTPAPVEVPGVYVLQAGSYSTHAEADRMKAQLALLGISSQIQRISVDEREYHRVRIGPIEQLDELNRLRRRLRAASVDFLVVRVGE